MTTSSASPRFLVAACHDLAVAEIDALDDRLYEFNRTTTGIDDGARLGFVVRDDTGNTIAAIAGTTWGGVCELKQLWVHQEHRRRGLGSALLAAAMEEAQQRDCHQILLTTHSFQAPAFYARHGFERIAEIADYPRGHRQLLMRRRLAMPPRG